MTRIARTGTVLALCLVARGCRAGGVAAVGPRLGAVSRRRRHWHRPRAQYEVAAQMAKARAVFPFTFAIMMGDNMYGTERTKDYEKKFEIPYKPLLDAKVEFYASLGNHDDPNQRLYKPFNMNGERFYTFKKGNVRFFALDSNYFDQTQATGWRRRWERRPRSGRSRSSITRSIRRAAVMDRKWTCERSSSHCS